MYRKEIQAGRRFRHFKGGIYEIVGMAIDTESGQEVVVYRSLIERELLWVRPYAMFIELVPEEKQAENSTHQLYRFEPFSEAY
jgi:hypothetical protein